MEKSRRQPMDLEMLEIEPLSDAILDFLGGSEISPMCCSIDDCSDHDSPPAPVDTWAA